MHFLTFRRSLPLQKDQDQTHFLSSPRALLSLFKNLKPLSLSPIKKTSTFTLLKLCNRILNISLSNIYSIKKVTELGVVVFFICLYYKKTRR